MGSNVFLFNKMAYLWLNAGMSNFLCILNSQPEMLPFLFMNTVMGNKTREEILFPLRPGIGGRNCFELLASLKRKELPIAYDRFPWVWQSSL